MQDQRPAREPQHGPAPARPVQPTSMTDTPEFEVYVAEGPPIAAAYDAWGDDEEAE